MTVRIWPRLTTLIMGLGLLVAAGACSRHRPTTGSAPPEPAGPVEVAVMATAGVHGQPALLARRAMLVDKARLAAKSIVQVDAGDFLPAPGDPAFADPAAFERRARLMLAAYQRMDVDAVTLGPRELAVDPHKLKAWAAATKLPIVVANVVTETGRGEFPAGRIVTPAGHKIGVFGVVDLGDAAQAVRDRQHLVASDPIAAAAEAARTLRTGGAEMVIALVNTAGGPARARAIVGSAPIDVIVCSGSSAETSGGTPVVMAPAPDGAQVGRLDVRGAPGAWRLTPHTLAVDAAVPEQFGTALLVRADTTPILGLPPPPGKKPPAKTGPVVYESWTYGSTRACAFCHKSQITQWETTDHAHAMETLKKKGHDHDPACVGCHSVGFLQPGGTANMETLAANFTNVGCEACHGPSAAHVRAPDNNKKSGTVRTVGPLVCLGCHTPDWNQGAFDYAVALKEVIGPGHGPTQPGGATP